MSKDMSDNITLVIDGHEIEARPGQMLIDVADDNGIVIPRFCYHKKLSVAANCRMCLVEVEKAPKPLPACATPVADGMVVKTRSQLAIEAQKSTMEFLLINHPLDCPVCDQGGECELQDVAMGFGPDVSEYSESKRVVADKDIGPLIATDLTRCILCTRCVRFGEEIAGQVELGAVGRGERSQIGTFLGESVSSEISGNVIDLCPVGALTAKPSRFRFRPWELIAHPAISAHDAVGSHLQVHTRNFEVIRVVPEACEPINETWLADRDRFSYTALESEQRLTRPLLRRDGKLVEVDWDEALAFARQQLQDAANGDGAIGGLIHPGCTLEEQYLFQKLLRGLGSNDIDHRLRQVDFSVDAQMPVMPWLGRSIESLQSVDAALILGGNLRHEQPLLNTRLRKAALRRDAGIASIAGLSGQYNYPLLADIAGSAEKQVNDLAAVLDALGGDERLSTLLDKASAKAEHKVIARALESADDAAVIVTATAAAMPHYGLLLQLAEAVARKAGASLSILGESANTAGAWLAGCLPHRGPAGAPLERAGRNAAEVLSGANAALLLMGVDPLLDSAHGQALLQNIDDQGFILSIARFDSEFQRAHADLVLPMATFLETSGCFVNGEGRWQPFRAAAHAPGAVRPGWRILHALERLLLPDSVQPCADSTAVRQQLQALCGDIRLDNLPGFDAGANKLPTRPRAIQRLSQTAIHAGDEMLRQAGPLQQSPLARQAKCLRVNAATAGKLGLGDGGSAHITQGEGTAILPVVVDESVATGCVALPAGIAETATLGHLFGSVTVENAS
jgi:NADH-quinone oxidoreductase subunit G